MGNRIETAENIFHLAFTLQKNFLRSVTPKTGLRLSILQVQVLDALKDKKPATMKDLANETRVSKQHLTNIIKKLVKEKIARREYDLHDRRVTRIRPTTTGLALLENIKKDALASLADKLEPLHEDDLVVLNSVVDRLTSLVDEEIDSPVISAK